MKKRVGKKNRFFDNWAFQNAYQYIKHDPLTAKKVFEEYLENYPYDYSAYSYYISILITLNKIDEAHRLLVLVNKTVELDKKYREDKKKVKIFENSIAINTIRILGYQEKYEELNNFYKCLNDEKLRKEYKIIPFLYNNRIGKAKYKRNDRYPYLYKQIIEYSEDDFRAHIEKHLSNDDNKDDKYSTAIFSEDFPIDKIIKETKKYIPSRYYLCHGFFDDKYTFKYDECGRDGKKLVNYFQVVTFHNSDNYITMFPSDNCENYPAFDLNYMLDKKEKVKNKTLSQIDKFNIRYNKKDS